MENVAGKVAFITGGANGIGLGIARAFVNAGMQVMIADIRADALAKAKAEFEARGQGESVATVELDVTNREQMRAAADETERVFGKVHVLVNNAGVGVAGPLQESTFDDWDWGMDVNLNGVINGTLVFMPRLNAHGEGGHIINTSSMSAVVPMKVAAIYIAAKSAVLGMSEQMRGELAEQGISVSAFCPGPVQSNIQMSGELRPEKYRKGSGLAKYGEDLKKRPVSPHWMSMDEVGERVLQGLKNDDLFIFTHPEFRDGLEARMKKMLAAFPDEPIDEERYEAIKWLTANDIYDE